MNRFYTINIILYFKFTKLYKHISHFIVNMLGALAAYCFFPKKPSIVCKRAIDTQLALF